MAVKPIIQNNCGNMLTIARITRNEKYLPTHLKLLMRCIDKGFNTTRRLMELNPLNYKEQCEKSMMGTYGRHLTKLYKMGFLDRDICRTGNANSYIYKKRKLTPMKLQMPRNCYLDI